MKKLFKISPFTLKAISFFFLSTSHVFPSFSFCNPTNYEGCGAAVSSFCEGMDTFCCYRARWCFNPCFPVWCPKEEIESTEMGSNTQTQHSIITDNNMVEDGGYAGILLESSSPQSFIIATNNKVKNGGFAGAVILSSPNNLAALLEGTKNSTDNTQQD